MSSLKELLCQLTGFLKPMMDRAVEDPLYRMHNGRSTFTLEINWAYSKDSKKIEKQATNSTVTKNQDGCRVSRRNLERNRRRRQRRKTARALHRTTTVKSPIVISPANTPPRSPMDTLPPGDGEPPPPPDAQLMKTVAWDPDTKDPHKIDHYGFLEEDPFMFRKITPGYPEDLITAAVPMYTTTANNVRHRAYGLTCYENNKHPENMIFRASKKNADFITALREVNTSVDVGEATHTR